MAAITLTPPQSIVLTLDGSDYTRAWTKYQASYSSADTSGLFLLNGTLTLSWWDNSIDLDERSNPDLNRGTEVQFTGLGLGSSMRIEFARYDDVGTTEIGVGCLLSYYNAAGPATIGVCVEPLTQKTLIQTVTDLLVLAGIPIGSIDLTGLTGKDIKDIINVDLNGSLISLAGALCFANGFALYQDNSGIIRVINLLTLENQTPISPIVDIRNSSFRYERLGDEDIPADQIVLRGSELVVNPLASAVESCRIIPFDGTPLSPSNWAQECEIETVDRSTRTITRRTTRTAPYRLLTNQPTILTGGFPAIDYISNVVETYEAKVPGFISVESGCIPRDEGRLIRRITEITRLRNIALEAFTDYGKAVGVNYSFSSFPQVIERTVEEWDYETTPNGLGAPEVTGLVYNKLRSQWKGVAMPIGGDPKWGRGGTTQALVVPDAFLPAEKEYEVIRRNPSTLRWRRQRTRSEIGWIARPDQATLKLQDNTIPLVDAINFAEKLITVERLNETSDAPSVDRFSPATALVNKDYVVSSIFNDGPRKKFISVDPHGSRQISQGLARYVGLLDWGRYRGRYLASDGTYSNTYPIRPLVRLDILEPSMITRNYLLDTPSISVTPNEYVFAGAGILLGSATGSTAGINVNWEEIENHSIEITLSADANIYVSFADVDVFAMPVITSTPPPPPVAGSFLDLQAENGNDFLYEFEDNGEAVDTIDLQAENNNFFEYEFDI